MRRLSQSRAQATRRGARGVAFLWMMLIGIPIAFLGLSMAVDLTRVVLAGREVNTATQAAALAAAYQFVPGSASIDPGKAAAAAVETMCVSVREGVVHNAAAGQQWRVACPGGQVASAHVQMVGANQVSVQSQYVVPNLLLVKYFGYGTVAGTATRAAAVCNSADPSGPTQGFCTRPTS